MWIILEDICTARGVSMENIIQFYYQNQREDFNTLARQLIPDSLLQLPMIRTWYLDRVPRQRQTVLAQCTSIIKSVLYHFSGPGQLINHQFITDLLSSHAISEMLGGNASLAFQIQRNVIAEFHAIPLQSSAFFSCGKIVTWSRSSQMSWTRRTCRRRSLCLGAYSTTWIVNKIYNARNIFSKKESLPAECLPCVGWSHK